MKQKTYYFTANIKLELSAHVFISAYERDGKYYCENFVFTGFKNQILKSAFKTEISINDWINYCKFLCQSDKGVDPLEIFVQEFGKANAIADVFSHINKLLPSVESDFLNVSLEKKELSKGVIRLSRKFSSELEWIDKNITSSEFSEIFSLFGKLRTSYKPIDN